MIRDAMDSLLENVRRVETELGKVIEFESKRIDELERRNKTLDTKVGSLEKEVTMLREKVVHLEGDINKGERYSRRNNFRIVGIKEAENPSQEDCVSLVEGILREKFGIATRRGVDPGGAGGAVAPPMKILGGQKYRFAPPIISAT